MWLYRGCPAMYSTPPGVNAEFTVYPRKQKRSQDAVHNASKIVAAIQSLFKTYSTTRCLALLMLENNTRVS